MTFREKWDWKDETVDDDWIIQDPKGRNARVVQKMKVQPFRQYHVTVKVRTKDFKGRPMVRVIAGGRVLNYAYLGVKPTQEWRVHHAVFNSLENKLIRVYLGCWNGTTGTLAWKDAKIEEGHPQNFTPCRAQQEEERALGFEIRRPLVCANRFPRRMVREVNRERSVALLVEPKALGGGYRDQEDEQ